MTSLIFRSSRHFIGQDPVELIVKFNGCSCDFHLNGLVSYRLSINEDSRQCHRPLRSVEEQLLFSVVLRSHLTPHVVLVYALVQM